MGVWGSSEDDVYCVGFIYDGSTAVTNVMHWDGTAWRALDYLEGHLNDVIGFGPDDVWVVGYSISGDNYYALAGHWNGSSWLTWKMYEHDILRAVWGTSSTDVYAVGNNGTILHYNGFRWNKMQSGTQHSLADIWGVNANSIYAAGGTYSTGAGILLRYSNWAWSTVYEKEYSPGTFSGFVSSVWGEKDTSLILSTSTGVYRGSAEAVIELNPPRDNTWIERVRGRNANDIFLVGHFGLVIHWNGVSWHRYDEIYDKSDGSFLPRIWNSGSEVFIVGSTDDSRAIIYHGR
jgi:hypothetical protein